MLQPLDTTKIVGGTTCCRHHGDEGSGDDHRWPSLFMPWDWGTTALTFNTEKIDEKDVQSLRRSPIQSSPTRVDRRRRRRAYAFASRRSASGLDQDDRRQFKRRRISCDRGTRTYVLLGRHDGSVQA